MTDRLMLAFGVLTTTLALAVLTGCSGGRTLTRAAGDTPPAGFGLAAPSEVARQVSAAGSPLFCRGQEHIPGAIKGVAPGAGDDLVFSPSWNPAAPDVAGMSYAIYAFPLDTYAGPAEIISSWDLEPDGNSSWIGLANNTYDGWDWYPFPSSGLLAYDPVVNINSKSELLVAYVILDDTDRILHWTRVGDDLPADASILADVRSGPIPLAVEFDAQFSEDFEGSIIKYEFDPEGDGTFVDNGTTMTYNHSYTAAGGYMAAVRVTDSAMNTSVAEVRIGACWKHSWGGPDYDSGQYSAVDSNGNTYVLGLTTGFGQGANELLILKFDPQGNIIWQKTMGDASGDDPGGIALDADDNVYICGSDLDPGDFDYMPFIFSLNPDGTLRWQVSWVPVNSAEATGVVCTPDGSVYMCCSYSDPFPAEPDVLLIKYNAADGTQLWAKTWGTIQSDRPLDMASDAAGNVYMLCSTNSFSVLNALYNAAIVGFDSDGNAVLETVYGVDAEPEPAALACAGDLLYISTGLGIAQITTAGELDWQAQISHATDDIVSYDILGVPGVGCFATFAIFDGFTEGGVVGLDLTGERFYEKAFRLGTAHQSIGGLSLLPDTGLMIVGRTADNTGYWEDYSLTMSTPTLDMTAVTGTVANHATVSAGSAYVLADVPFGSITVDTGGGGNDATVQRFYPFEPSSW